MYAETRFGIGAISTPMFVTDIGQHWAEPDMCNVLFQYVANMTACLILVKYSYHIAPILHWHCSYIKKRYFLLILELYWADIPTILIQHIANDFLLFLVEIEILLSAKPEVKIIVILTSMEIYVMSNIIIIIIFVYYRLSHATKHMSRKVIDTMLDSKETVSGLSSGTMTFDLTWNYTSNISKTMTNTRWRRRVFTGQMTQPAVSKHWRKIWPND